MSGAAFESGLRSYWKSHLGRKSREIPLVISSQNSLILKTAFQINWFITQITWSFKISQNILSKKKHRKLMLDVSSLQDSAV